MSGLGTFNPYTSRPYSVEQAEAQMAQQAAMQQADINSRNYAADRNFWLGINQGFMSQDLARLNNAAQLGLAGQNNQAEMDRLMQSLAGQRYGYDTQAQTARYGADQTLQGQLAAAAANRYGSDAQLQGQLGSAQMGLQGQLAGYGTQRDIAQGNNQTALQQAMMQSQAQQNLANIQGQYGLQQAALPINARQANFSALLPMIQQVLGYTPPAGGAPSAAPSAPMMGQGGFPSAAASAPQSSNMNDLNLSTQPRLSPSGSPQPVGAMGPVAGREMLANTMGAISGAGSDAQQFWQRQPMTQDQNRANIASNFNQARIASGGDPNYGGSSSMYTIDSLGRAFRAGQGNYVDGNGEFRQAPGGQYQAGFDQMAQNQGWTPAQGGMNYSSTPRPGYQSPLQSAGAPSAAPSGGAALMAKGYDGAPAAAGSGMNTIDVSQAGSVPTGGTSTTQGNVTTTFAPQSPSAAPGSGMNTAMASGAAPKNQSYIDSYNAAQSAPSAAPSSPLQTGGLLGGGSVSGGSIPSMGGSFAPLISGQQQDQMLNGAFAGNAQNAASAMNRARSQMGSRGWAPSSPALAGMQNRVDFNRMNADTQARTSIPLQVAQANGQFGLQQGQQGIDWYRARTGSIAPLISALGSLV